MIKVILVDDHKLIRSIIKKLLDDISDIKVVAEAASGEEAVSLVRQSNCNVILLDIKLPGISGLETVRKLLHVNRHLKIIIMTAIENDIFPARLMQAGAYGYLTKGTGKEELVEAIRSVNEGRRHLSMSIAQRLTMKTLSESDKTPLDSLSDREFDVLLMVAQGIKVTDISKKLHLSSKTVNSYRYRIFDKLGLKNDVDLTHLALKYQLLDFESVL